MIARLFSRKPSLLPPESGAERWLVVVVAVLCFLASVTAVGALAADRAAHGWAGRLRGEVTVQVRPRVDESGATAAGRAAEALAGMDGVAEAEALDRKAAEALLRPWVGEAVLSDLPLPFLVTVRLNDDRPASLDKLSQNLAEAGLDATVDDHSLWRGEVERAAAILSALALTAFALIAAATGAVIAYATRAGMAAQASVIETLNLNGAPDSLIAGLFQERFGGLALRAGGIGAAAAGLVLAAARLMGGSEGLTPALPLAFGDLMMLILCPIAAFTVAIISARLTALAKLAGRG
ncbi:cell division protein FtsX [Brevundimonas vesicularis]|uniref:cell division protein FtsX n=1 Tax=Brevundimonas vesicularis TaxID=41276 RepID=UPI0038D3C46C